MLDKGKNEPALKEFQAAYALVPNPKIQFNMGLALEGLHRKIEALEAFDAFLAAPLEGIPEEKREEARKHRAASLAKVAVIKVVSAVSAATVTIDGVGRGATPFDRPIYLEAGTHRLLADAAGQPPFVQIFTTSEGTELTLSLSFAAAKSESPPPNQSSAAGHPGAMVNNAKRVEAPLATAATTVSPPPTIPTGAPLDLNPPARPATPNSVDLSTKPAAGPREWRGPAKWASFGLAAAGLGVGILETIIAVRKSNEFNDVADNCMDDGNGHIRGGARCEQIDHDQTVATWAAGIAYGLAGLSAAAGLVLHFSSPANSSGGGSSTLIGCSIGAPSVGPVCAMYW